MEKKKILNILFLVGVGIVAALWIVRCLHQALTLGQVSGWNAFCAACWCGVFALYFHGYLSSRKKNR